MPEMFQNVLQFARKFSGLSEIYGESWNNNSHLWMNG